MFINLTNIDIPFEEYYLTQDKIDALKYRLLLHESYLTAYEIEDEQSSSKERFCVFLLYVKGKLMFFIVPLGEDIECLFPSPLQMIDVSGDEWRVLPDNEVISYIVQSYEQNPEDAFIKDPYIEIDVHKIVESLHAWINDYVTDKLLVRPQESTEDPVNHHYEAIYEPYMKNYTYEEKEAEAEYERLMTIILKKVYGLNYQNYETF